MEMGLLVAAGLLEDEVTRLCGRRYQHQPECVHTQYSHQPGIASLAGQKVSIKCPECGRPRAAEKCRWIMYARLQSPDDMPCAVHCVWRKQHA